MILAAFLFFSGPVLAFDSQDRHWPHSHTYYIVRGTA